MKHLHCSILLLFSIEVTSDDGSDDDNGAVTALAILFAIAVIGLVISVVIIVFLVVKLKQSRYAANRIYFVRM